jgi:hypothetical protein
VNFKKAFEIRINGYFGEKMVLIGKLVKSFILVSEKNILNTTRKMFLRKLVQRSIKEKTGEDAGHPDTTHSFFKGCCLSYHNSFFLQLIDLTSTYNS